MNCPQCLTENPPDARFCYKCGQMLVLNCSSCQTELPAGARFCMHCGHPAITSTPVDENRFTRLVASTPNRLAQKVKAAADLYGERRIVTILLVDVVGSTSLSEQLDVETWSSIMNGIFDRITPIIYRYEGTIARLLGDSLLVFFGAPVVHEDDPIRAVRCALTLIRSGQMYAEEIYQKYGIDFAIRVCINTGQVIIGAVQEDLKYEYTAMGGAVNLVSRLKFAAQPMTVLISEYTYRFVAAIFECNDLGPIPVKGITDPVGVYQVYGPRAQPGQLRGLAGLKSPMVGRKSELADLIRLYNTVRAGVGRTVLIVGDPGLGKTRLIAEWKAIVLSEQPQIDLEAVTSNLIWIEGRCQSFGQGFAYHLLDNLLRSIIRVPEAAGEPQTRAALLALTEELFGESALEIYPYLGHLLALNMSGEAFEKLQLSDPQVLRTQYIQAFLQLIRALSSRSPLVFVLEDLHWSDPSSTELLIELLSFILSAPILLCLVTRPEPDTPGWKLISAARKMTGGSLTELTLSPLSEMKSKELVSNLLAVEALSEPVQNTILSKAEGNPFFVEEVIRMLIDQEAIIQENRSWVVGKEIRSADIPDNLQGLLLARIDRLPEEVKQTLRVAAVIGRQFPKKVLARVLGEDQIG